jgi:hypothetical protein
VKVLEEEFGPTVTEDGTVNSDGTLLVRATEVLLVTDFVRVTVQLVLALEARADAVHCTEEIAGKLDSKIVAD